MGRLDEQKLRQAHAIPSLPTTFGYYWLYRRMYKYPHHDKQLTLRPVALDDQLSLGHIFHVLLISQCYPNQCSSGLTAQTHMASDQIAVLQSIALAQSCHKHLTAKPHQTHRETMPPPCSLQSYREKTG